MVSYFFLLMLSHAVSKHLFLERLITKTSFGAKNSTVGTNTLISTSLKEKNFVNTNKTAIPSLIVLPLMKKMINLKVNIENVENEDSKALFEEKIVDSQVSSTKNKFTVTSKNQSKKQLSHSVKQLSQNLINVKMNSTMKSTNGSKKIVGKMEKLQKQLQKKNSMDIKINTEQKISGIEVKIPQQVKLSEQKKQKLSLLEKNSEGMKVSAREDNVLSKNNSLELDLVVPTKNVANLTLLQENLAKNNVLKRTKVDSSNSVVAADKLIKEKRPLKNRRRRRRSGRSGRRRRRRRRSPRVEKVVVEKSRRKSIADNVASVAKTAIIANTVTSILRPSRDRGRDRDRRRARRDRRRARRARREAIDREAIDREEDESYTASAPVYPVDNNREVYDPTEKPKPTSSSKVIMGLIGAIIGVLCICAILNQMT